MGLGPLRKPEEAETRPLGPMFFGGALRRPEEGASSCSGEVLARLVAAAVFKTVGTRVNRGSGGFDSHALPFFSEANREKVRFAAMCDP